jgi:hypothetical protein
VGIPFLPKNFFHLITYPGSQIWNQILIIIKLKRKHVKL